MYVLGIESSCDETGAAVVNEKKEICSNVLWTQIKMHTPFGGVVPEIAARAHLERIDEIVGEAMEKAGIGFEDLSAVAVSAGPGLIGGVIVGVMTAKAICAAHRLPFVALNHLEGHALTSRLTGEVEFPFLLLLVSGGHCQILVVKGVGQYEKLGGTMDDSAGEAFDKVSKMLGLGYPGGPKIEAAAKKGNASRFEFPVPMKGRPGCDFSFSGLKTSVRHTIEQLTGKAPGAEILPEEEMRRELTEQEICDIAASFQAAVLKTVKDRLEHAVKIFKSRFPTGKDLVVAGGVASNTALRGMLTELAEKNKLQFTAPPVNLCTDNAVMVAWAGLERFREGLTDSLDFKARPRWPLDASRPGKK